MNWDAITKRAADFARPFAIYFFAICIGAYLLIRGDGNALVAVIGLLGVMVGVRGYENVAQTKADASVRTSQTIATPEKIVTTDKQGQTGKPATETT